MAGTCADNMLGRTAVFILCVASATQAVCANSGLRVEGTQVVDGKGYGFVMRGINYAHSWYKEDADKAIPAIAATNANVVRIVLSDGDVYTKDDAATVKHLLDLCQKNQLVAMLEVHDATGSDDVWMLNRAADYWISLADMLRGLEDRVIINIANEWHGSSGQAEAWASAYRSVLPRLRNAGLNHLIVVDSAGWGQDAGCIAQKGRSIFEADPLRNTIFSIHMYEVAGKDEATVKRHIDNSLAIGVPLIIGEFSDAQGGKPVDYKSIMSYCSQRSVGWLAWSWYGNNADTANMDLSYGPAGGLTELGKKIVNGADGIQSTAWPVSTWEAASNSPSVKGLQVSGTQVVDGNGYGFVMRGINYAHSWYKEDADKAIPAIAATNANVVRIVLSDGDVYTKDDAATVKHLLDLCHENHLVAMLEVHDATGSDDVWMLNRAADYWISLADMLRGLEDRVIINVANEWHGSSGQAEAWASAYRSVLPRLRNAGLNHLFVVDSAGWGQDAGCIAQKGRSIFEADPLRNTIFSIHMYEVAGKDEATVKRHIDNSLAIGVPLIIGEFSDAQGGKPVDYKSIMSYCSQRSVGWLAWSWYGNNADTANMDLSYGPAGGLTELGKKIVNGADGIQSTAWPVSTWW